ncbi:MAG: FHA domain-containing protein [Myxococcales bacterium]
MPPPSAPPSGRKPVPPRSQRDAPAPENSTVLFDTLKQGGGAKRPESTVLFDSRKLQQAASRARLVGLKGKRRGVQFPLSGTEVTIGRDPTNDVVIADISVSRKQAQMRRLPDGWLIADAGGGNGTRVNGLAIEEVLLHDGDLIEFGNTELQFVEPPAPVQGQGQGQGEEEDGEAAGARRTGGKAAPGKKGPSPLVKNVAVGVFALFAVLIAVKLLLPAGARHGPGAMIAAGPDVDQFALARKLILSQKWSEAKAALLKAKEDDPDNPEIRRYLDTVGAEIINQQHLDAATAAFAKQDLVTSLKELKLVGEGSLLSDASAALKVKIDAAVAALTQKASDALAARDLPTAKQFLDQAMAAEPTQPQALALLPKLNGQLAVARVTAEEAERARKQQQALTRLEQGPVGQARRFFISGDLSGALATIRLATGPDAVPGAELANHLAAFSEANQRGRQALASRRNQLAIEQLGDAHRLAVDIGGTSAAPAVSTGKLLSQLHDQMGMQARSARAMDKAYRHFAAALDANPADGQAREQLHRLETEAEELYQIGYGQKGSDPAAAAKSFRLVVQMTGPSSPWHQKAQERLKQLGGGAP